MNETILKETTVNDLAEWKAPASGYWRRDFRIPEWIPAPVSRSAATWLLPGLDDGFNEASEDTFGIRVGLPATSVVNGWCYARDPRPTNPAALLRHPALMVKVAVAMTTFQRHPERAKRTIVDPARALYLQREWPAHQHRVEEATSKLPTASPTELVAIVDDLTRSTGTLMMGMVQCLGFAGKAEFALATFHSEHLRDAVGQSHVVLLSGLLDPTAPAPHTVASLDWIEPTTGELGLRPPAPSSAARELRIEAEAACRAALAGTKHAERFEQLLALAQEAVPVRNEMVEQFTLAWPVLRQALLGLGSHLVSVGVIGTAADVFHLGRDEIAAAVQGDRSPRHDAVEAARAERDRQFHLRPPMALGKAVGPWKKLEEAADLFRLPVAEGSDVVVRGVPSGAGLATGKVRVVRGPDDFDSFEPGEVLVATATAPAWTPLFAMAAAVVTDSGSPFAHAAVVAREFGIPAIVGTGDATVVLASGDHVRVDGDRGTVERLA